MIFKNARQDIAILVVDSPDAVALVTRDGFATWALKNLTRSEFTRSWKPWTPTIQPLGAPTPIEVSDLDTLRKIVRGPVTGLTPQFELGVLEAIALKFPIGPVCLFDRDEGPFHHFSEREDAELFGKRALAHPVIFGSPVELGKLPVSVQSAVAAALESSHPAKPNAAYYKELYEMAKKAKAKQKKKVTNVQAKAKRADGPVARAHAIFKAGDAKDTASVLEACAKAGISPATAKTQLYVYRKQHGIKAERGRPGTKKAKEAKAKPAVKKAGGKKAGGKKKAKGEPAPTLKQQMAATPKDKTRKLVKKDAPPVEAPKTEAPAAGTQQAPVVESAPVVEQEQQA